eukprot:Tbor_TRINITY_DN5354_c0_g3::TRINITY_DN5354_c0_g3_i2::g.4610::m.4610/K07767/KATNA1; katanin p60 ATPase-containing subunit A1
MMSDFGFLWAMMSSFCAPPPPRLIPVQVPIQRRIQNHSHEFTRPLPQKTFSGNDSTYTSFRRRNELEREGIVARSGSRSSISASISSGSFNARSSLNETTPGRRVQTRPLPTHHYERMFGWKQLTSGGRSQSQNIQQNHLLMTTDESYPNKTNEFNGCDALIIEREEPVDFSDVSPTHTMHIRTMLKSLTGSGKYSTFIIGFTSSPPESCSSFVGLSVHYEYTGAIYVSVDEWSITRDSSLTGNVCRSIERGTALHKPQQVKSKRDGLDIHISFTYRSMGVHINDHLFFKDVASQEFKEDPKSLYIIIMAAGGRFSAKHVEITDSVGTCGVISTRVSNRSNTRCGGRPAVVSKLNLGGGRPGIVGRSSGGGGGVTPQNGRAGGVGKQVEDSSDPFAQMIENEIIDRGVNVSWDDVCGVGDAKTLLNEAVVLPLLVPELFTGARAPWKGVLMYGPPGTGKTMLAKAVATCAKTTFYNISASTLLSRYHGESEKICKALFQSARRNSPSTIFFDEIDALMCSRGSGGENEASRRLKCEMLQQIDGLGSDDGSRIMILATTNIPWELDVAMRRRLEKRIYIPLPDLEGRREFLRTYIKKSGVTIDSSINLEELATSTDGFSGADLNIVCRDAAMMPMRRLIANKSPQQITEMRNRGEMSVVPPITMADFRAALDKVNPTVSQDQLKDYEDWTKEFGSN